MCYLLAGCCCWCWCWCVALPAPSLTAERNCARAFPWIGDLAHDARPCLVDKAQVRIRNECGEHNHRENALLSSSEDEIESKSMSGEAKSQTRPPPKANWQSLRRPTPNKQNDTKYETYCDENFNAAETSTGDKAASSKVAMKDGRSSGIRFTMASL